MVELYVIIAVVIIAIGVTVFVHWGRKGASDDLAARLGLALEREREDGSTRLVGSFSGIEVVIVVGRAPSEQTVLEAKVRGRPAPGVVDQLLGESSVEPDLEFDKGVLKVREADQTATRGVEPDPELQDSLTRVRERFPGGELELSDTGVRLSIPTDGKSSEAIEQALRDVVDLAETLEVALAEAGAGVTGWDRASSPSFIPPESSSDS